MTHPAENGPSVKRAIVVGLEPEQTWPHYFSTYCIHEQHGDCRLTCKVCRAVCRCDCHAPTPPVVGDPQ